MRLFSGERTSSITSWEVEAVDRAGVEHSSNLSSYGPGFAGLYYFARYLDDMSRPPPRRDLPGVGDEAARARGRAGRRGADLPPPQRRARRAERPSHLARATAPLHVRGGQLMRQVRALRARARPGSWLRATRPPSAWARAILAVTIAFRLLIEPYYKFADQPDPLFFGAYAVRWLGSMPPVGVVIGLQVLGVVAAVACIAGKAPRAAFLVAWGCLLVLGGIRGSVGKILHNDVMLLLACVPVLFSPVGTRIGSLARGVAFGWPRRGALLIASAVYCMTGVQKLRHSGLDWVMSKNLRWVLYNGAADGKAPTDVIALFVANRAWLATATGIGFLSLEVGAPLLAIWSRRSRWLLLVGSLALHVGTYLTLGLHYWGWVLTITALVVPWDELSRRRHARV